MPFDIETLDTDAREYVAGLQAQLAAYDVEEPAALPDDLPDAVLKALNEQSAVIAKMESEKAELAKSLVALEDKIATEQYEKRAAQLINLFGEGMAPVLKALAAGAPEAYTQLDEKLDKLLSINGYKEILEKEFGSSSDGGTAADQIAAHAVEIRKANPDMSPAEARAQAWRENPALVTQSREEG